MYGTLASSHTGHTSQVPYRAACRKFASYEHVRGHFRKRITSYRLFALLNKCPTGYSHPRTRESDNRYSGLYVTYYRGDFVVEKGVKEHLHYKQSKAYKTNIQQYIKQDECLHDGKQDWVAK